MDKAKMITGFSKMNKDQKIFALSGLSGIKKDFADQLFQFNLGDNALQAKMDEISENVISNYILPFSIAPNFLINNKLYFIPMVTDESSVVASASAGAKFWSDKGGFTCTVNSTFKLGHIHFTWPGNIMQLQNHKHIIQKILKESVNQLMNNMVIRGGGIKDIEIIDYSDRIKDYYQVKVIFNTAQAMGANIINSSLEQMANTLKQYFQGNFTGNLRNCDIIMAILSNHNPDCIVECSVGCEINQLGWIYNKITAQEFVNKFKLAVEIANIDIYRASTHNKGIFNGIDAVMIATGNDFRAVEAGGHSYAASSGNYKSLTSIYVDEERFKYSLKIPMAIGTVGGLTNYHPLARISFDILGHPSVDELMQVAAAVGLANNFSAIRALITSGIQKGHMKFHLNNILISLNADENEKKEARLFFKEQTITFDSVKQFITGLRNN